MSAKGEAPEPNPDDPAFTTLAIGEEGGDDSASGPGMAFLPSTIQPSRSDLVSTRAVGEEGEQGGTPPIATTAAIGEEGGPPLTATTLAIGEEGDGGWGSRPIESPSEGGTEAPAAGEDDDGILFTTLAVGEEGEGGIISDPLDGTEPAAGTGDGSGGQATTLAIGEGGDGGPCGWGGAAAPGSAGRPWGEGEAMASTMALGEEGAPIFGSWES